MKKNKYLNSPKEIEEQTALFDWAHLSRGKYPALALLHHIPNGGSRHPMEAANLKRQGVKPGVPDIFLPVARKGFHGLYIELKRAKGGTVSKAQQEMLIALRCEGYAVEVCYGCEEAMKVIEGYLGDEREKING